MTHGRPPPGGERYPIQSHRRAHNRLANRFRIGGIVLPQGGHPPHHSITSSARAIRVAGTSRPTAFAVLRLIARLAPAPETRAVIVGSVRACLRRPFERLTGASW